MSFQQKVTVPEGMSCVNAFHALWKEAKPTAFIQLYPRFADRHAQVVADAQRVAELFRTQTHFTCVGGKSMDVDFAFFPTLICHEKRAKEILEQYHRIASKNRFDALDSYKFTALTGKRLLSAL